MKPLSIQILVLDGLPNIIKESMVSIHSYMSAFVLKKRDLLFQIHQNLV